MRGFAAWILSLAIALHGGLGSSAALAGAVSALCTVPPTTFVYLASADGSADWLTTDPETAEPLGYCQHCYCAEWSEGYYDGACLFACGAACSFIPDPVLRAACYSACLPGCWVSPQCIRVECENLGDICVDP